MSQESAHAAPYAGNVPVATPAAGLFRLAGYCAIGAIATLVVAGVALALYFGGAGDIFGPINDVFTALTLLLLIPAAVAVRQLAEGRVGGWFSAVTLLTIGGLSLAAAGFVLLVAGVISLEASFVTFGIGMLPFLAWVVGLAIVSLRHGVISRTVGWFIVAFLVITAAAIGGMLVLPMDVLSFTLAPLLFVALAGWLGFLGRDLLRRAEPRDT